MKGLIRSAMLAVVVMATSDTTAEAQTAIFSNPITDGNPSASNPFTSGQTFDPNITVSGIGRGSGISPNAGTDRYNASSWNTAGIDNSAFFFWTLTPNADNQINFQNLVYTGQRSGTGPNTFAFRSSVDGFAADIGTPTATGTTISLSAAEYQNVASAIEFRFYGWGASSAAGTFSINDFTFNGAVVTTTPIPEPTSILAVATLAVGGVAGWRRRRAAHSRTVTA